MTDNNSESLFFNKSGETGVWMVGAKEDLSLSTPVSFNQTDDPSKWNEWEAKPTEKGIELQLVDPDMIWEFTKKPHVCLGSDGSRVNLNEEPGLICNGNPDCRLESDETLKDEHGLVIHSCPFYVNPEWWFPYMISIGVMLVILKFLILDTVPVL